MTLRTLVIAFIGFAVGAFIMLQYEVGSLSYHVDLLCQHAAVRGC